jgi:4-carboxymuconolactone decarboxylase
MTAELTCGEERIQLLSPETMNAEQRAVFDAIVAGPRKALVGPLRAALHNPMLADRWQRFGQVLRFETSVPAVLNELAILLTARRWNCVLEWTIHERDALRAGMPAAWLKAIRNGSAPDLCDDEPAAEIYRYVRQLLHNGDVDAGIHRAVRQRFGERGVVEITAVVGYYTMVAMTLNAHRIPLPDGFEASLPIKGAGLTDLPDLLPCQV